MPASRRLPSPLTALCALALAGAASVVATRAAIAGDPRPVVLERAVHGAFSGGRLEVVAERRGEAIALRLKNGYATPVTADFDYQLTNMAPVTAPRTLTIPAGGEVAAAAFKLDRPDRPFRYHYTINWLFGTPDAASDDALYDLPFSPGTRHRVLQGYYGAFSHADVAAIDWAMPEGTPVLAAREGVVVACNDTALGNGLEPAFRVLDKANWVFVRHADGTLGCYFHLAPHGVLVHPGDRVARHQPLATSGNTGYSTGPHLHFEVRTPIDGSHFRTYPVRFRTGQGSDIPLEGKSYTAPA